MGNVDCISVIVFFLINNSICVMRAFFCEVLLWDGVFEAVNPLSMLGRE